MNREKAGVVIYFALVLCAVVLIANYYMDTRDISWIGEVEDFIRKEDWVADSEYIPMQDWAFFLYENGTNQYFYLVNQEEFITYINNILNRVNRQVEESVSEDTLNEILSNGKVLELAHRFSTKSFGWVPTNEFDRKIDYRIAYFVLDDVLGTDLEGTIIIRETNSKISVWQITSGFLW